MRRQLLLLFAVGLLAAVSSLARAQSLFHIDRVSAPTQPPGAAAGSPGSIAISGRLPDFLQGSYQVCVSAPGARQSAAPVTPTLRGGLTTIAYTAPTRPLTELVYIVPTGGACNGSYDPGVTNALPLPAFGGPTPTAPPSPGAKANSIGTITATPNPVLPSGSTVLSAQFQKDPATQATAPEPGAPSGAVTFLAGGQTVPGSNLVLDTTAVFKPQAGVPLAPPTVASPVFTPAAGTYAGTQSVTISDSTPGATIYYTTDGSAPSAQSPMYTGPIPVAVSETISAIAIASGYLNSPVVSSAYTIRFGTPTQLVFTTEPTDTGLTQAITPAVAVTVEDASGNVVGNSTLAISIHIAANPAQGTLGGTLTENAVNGVATFADLSIDQLGSGYTLQAMAPGVSAPISAPFNIIPYPITLNLQGPLIGIGATLPGTFTLTHPAPAGGIAVSLASSAPANVTVQPATVTVAAGATTGSFTYTGVAVGPSTLTASATGYTAATATVTTTTSQISVGAIPVIAPGQTVDLPLSLATPAPAGGITVRFTSSNPRIATITPSVFIAAGRSVAPANPQITGVSSGTAVISATATGYAPYVSVPPATVTVSATFPSGGITINQSSGFSIQLSISYPAPVGGITFTLSSDDPTKVTLPASVTIVHGASSVQIPLTGVAPGQTTIRADSPGITETTSTVNVNNTIYNSNVLTGNKLEVATRLSFGVAPPTPTTATITIANPAIATIALNGSTVGTASLTVNNITSGTIGTIFVQGQAIGTTTLTVSAPGYANSSSTITVNPSGFVINLYTSSAGIQTTTFSGPQGFTVYPAILNSDLSYNTTEPINPGVGAITVPITSSSPATGTVTSPLTFHALDTAQNGTFTPVAPGTTTISLGASSSPAFSVSTSYQTIATTVTAPPISTNNVVTGAKLEVPLGASLGATPPTPVTVTVTSNNPSVALISTSPTTVGSATLTLPNRMDTGLLSIYVQGLAVGTTTLTFSAPGYTTATSNVSVYPSGFAISGYYATLSTTTFSSPTSFPVYPAILNPGSLTYYSNAALSPGVGPVSVGVSDSSTATGTASSAVVFNTGDQQQNITFTPANAGTTTLSLVTPAGFSTGAQYQTSVATVTAPPIYTLGNLTVGVKLQVGSGISLSQTPPSAVTVTVTSSNPAVATLSTSSTAVGGASVTYPGVTGNAGSVYVEGQSVGTSTITTSAPGFATTTSTVTVYPSGFIFNGGSFTTTTFSQPNGVAVVPVLLDPTSFQFAGYGTLGPGVGPVTVRMLDSNAGIGTLSAVPLVFNTGDTVEGGLFTPVAAGTTTLSLGVPTGFSAPQPAGATSITATVTAPMINTTDLAAGVNLEGYVGIQLAQPPPNPINVTVTSNGPTIALISSDPTTAGTGTVTFTNVTGGSVGPIYVQGQAIGTTTLTISATGYSSALSHISVQPSGFAFNSGDLTTTVSSGPTQIQVAPFVLTPGTLTIDKVQLVSPGAGAVSVPIATSNSAVGALTNAPILFNGDSTAVDSYGYATFTPLAPGTSTISIGTPAGFSTPSQQQSITATVQ